MDIDKDKIEQLFEILHNSKNILIPIASPDGDSVGCSLALKLILEKMGKEVKIISSFSIPRNLLNLPGSKNINYEDLYSTKLIEWLDLVIMPDTASIDQLIDLKVHSGKEFKFPIDKKVVNIDHHRSNDNFATLTILDPEAPSAGEIIYKIFLNKIEYDTDIALCLFTAISTDTGHFRYTCKPETLMIAGELLKFNINIHDLIINNYYTKSLSAMKLVAIALERMIIDKKNKYCLTFLKQEDLKISEANNEDLQEAEDELNDNLIQSVMETDFGVRLTEEKNNYVSGSLRGRTDLIDLNQIAKKLDGGGHHDAAGFHLRCSLESALIRVKETINNILQ